MAINFTNVETTLQNKLNTATDSKELLLLGKATEAINAAKGAAETSAAITTLAPKESPALTGTPTAPTANVGTNTTQLATTAFVQGSVQTAVDSVKGAAPSGLDTLGEVATAIANDPAFSQTVGTAIAAKANLNSPQLTGTPTAPTPTTGDDSTKIATTAFVKTAVSSTASASIVVYDEHTFASSGWSSSSTYGSVIRGPGGFDAEQFGFVIPQTNSGLNQTRMRCKPFQVDRTTGYVTPGVESDAWLNTSGQGTSTMWTMTAEGSGKWYMGAHHAIPGYSGHQFHLSYGRFTSSNTHTDGGYSHTNADHGYNGNYQSLSIDANNSQYYGITAGYNANSASTAHYRVTNFTGTTPSFGSLTSVGSDTSTSYNTTVLGQPGLLPLSTTPVSMVEYQTSPSARRFAVINSSGSVTTHANPLGSMGSTATAFHLQNGNVFYTSENGCLLWTSYTSTPTVVASPVPWENGNFRSEMTQCIGNDTWVTMVGSSSLYSPVPYLVRFTVSNAGITVTGYADAAQLGLGLFTAYVGLRYIKSSSGVFDKLIWTQHRSGAEYVKVTNLPIFK